MWHITWGMMVKSVVLWKLFCRILTFIGWYGKFNITKLQQNTTLRDSLQQREYKSFALLALCKKIPRVPSGIPSLTHWGRVTHICVGNLTIIGSDNGLSPGRRQAIPLTNAGILLIGPLETNTSEIFIGIKTRKWTRKCRLWNGVRFALSSMCLKPARRKTVPCHDTIMPFTSVSLACRHVTRSYKPHE